MEPKEGNSLVHCHTAAEWGLSSDLTVPSPLFGPLYHIY